ncbi:TetR/AcrR family transcriptional regulator [Microvirga flocculans]|uniref:TetR/AcrR family transcriptional regulator n=1 Tax=Microvirga flocculans TaxID=217168 RepID=UPI00137851D9|nr:TetR/AcrR family transcriptional regulator [Microvirga flocculans]
MNPPPRKTRRSQAERSQDSRRKLIEAAIAVLSEAGFAGAATPLIAERAGVSRGLMTHHFPTKRDLLVAVVEHLSEQMIASFKDDFEHDMPSGIRAEIIVDRIWALYSSNIYRALIQIHVGASVDPALAGEINEIAERTSTAVKEAWRRSLSARTDIPHEVIDQAGSFLLTQMRGMALQRFFGRPRDYSAQLRLTQTLFSSLLSDAKPMKKSKDKIQ